MFKGSYLFQTIILGIHVSFRGCNLKMMMISKFRISKAPPHFQVRRRRLNQSSKTSRSFAPLTKVESSPIDVYIYMGVSKNNGTPKSSILIGFSLINHPFWGTPIFENTHIPGPSSLGAKCFRYRVSNHHPLGFNPHPLESAAIFAYIFIHFNVKQT